MTADPLGTVDKDVEKWEPPPTAGGNVKFTLENRLAGSRNDKQIYH